MNIRYIINKAIDKMIADYEARRDGTLAVYVPPKPTILERLLRTAKKVNPILAACCLVVAFMVAAFINMGARIHSLQSELEKQVVANIGGVMMYVTDSDYTIITSESIEKQEETTTTALVTTTTTEIPTTTTEAPTTTKPTTTTTTAEATPVQNAKPDDGKPKAGQVYDVSMDICRFIAEYEGNYAPYRCEARCWTVGYGHAYTSEESKKWSKERAIAEFNKDIERALGKSACLTATKTKLTNEEAMKLLQYDLNRGDYKKKLDVFIQKNKLILTRQQYDALLSFAYNCGPNVWNTKSFKFRDTLLRYKDGSKIPPATVRNQMDNWNHAGGKELKGLTRRRRNEARLFSTGSYKILQHPDDY